MFNGLIDKNVLNYYETSMTSSTPVSMKSEEFRNFVFNKITKQWKQHKFNLNR